MYSFIKRHKVIAIFLTLLISAAIIIVSLPFLFFYYLDYAEEKTEMKLITYSKDIPSYLDARSEYEYIETESGELFGPATDDRVKLKYVTDKKVDWEKASAYYVEWLESQGWEESRSRGGPGLVIYEKDHIVIFIHKSYTSDDVDWEIDIFAEAH